MKTIFAFILVVVSAAVRAQNSMPADSAQIRMNEARDLYAHGLISAEEYAAIRTLYASVKRDTQPQQQPGIVYSYVTKQIVLKPATPVQLHKLKATGAGLLGAGVVLLTGVPACLLGVAFNSLGNNGIAGVYITVTGLFALGAGLGLTITGAKKLSLYHKYIKQQAMLKLYGNGLGLAYVF